MDERYSNIKFRFLILWYVLAIIGFIIALPIVFNVSGSDEGMTFTIVGQFGLYLIAILWVKRSYRKSGLSIGGLFKPIRRSNGLASKSLFIIFHITFSLSAVSFLFYLISFLIPDFLIEMMEDGAATQSFVTQTSIPSFILIVLIAPIVEELVFRGTLLQKIRYKYGNVAGILISSAIFSVIHLNSGMIGHFTLGVFLCIFYLQTKNIWVPIICHALNNVLAFSGFLFDGASGSGSIGEAIDEIQQIGHYFGIYALTCLVFLIWFAITQIKKLNHHEKLKLELKNESSQSL